jgi:hypothetical protein
MSEASRLTGREAVIYLILAEGSRLFPPYNRIPAPSNDATMLTDPYALCLRIDRVFAGMTFPGRDQILEDVYDSSADK